MEYCINNEPRAINYILHNLISENELEKADILFSQSIGKIFKGKEKKAFNSLLLKYYFKSDKIDEFEELYNRNKEFLMKRDILLYCQILYFSNIEKCINEFKYLVETSVLAPNDIDFLIDNKMDKCLELLDGYYSLTKNIGSERKDSTLKFYPYKKETIEKLLDIISKPIEPDIFSFCKRTFNFSSKEKIVIDGGNLLFCKKGQVSEDGYKLIVNIMKTLDNKGFFPILIIHNRHLKVQNKNMKTVSSIKFLKNNFSKHIFETPYNQNDDLYLIFATLFFSCKIMSNDNYKDHIFSASENLDELEKFTFKNILEDLSLKYVEKDNKLDLKRSLKKYSNCIQRNGRELLIPSKNNKVYKYLL